jgi:hypothetical protein
MYTVKEVNLGNIPPSDHPIVTERAKTMSEKTKSVFSRINAAMSKPMGAKELGITYLIITLMAIGAIVAFVSYKTSNGAQLNTENLPLLIVAGVGVLLFGAAMYTSSVKNMKKQDAAGDTSNSTGQ